MQQRFAALRRAQARVDGMGSRGSSSGHLSLERGAGNGNRPPKRGLRGRHEVSRFGAVAYSRAIGAGGNAECIVGAFVSLRRWPTIEDWRRSDKADTCRAANADSTRYNRVLSTVPTRAEAARARTQDPRRTLQTRRKVSGRSVITRPLGTRHYVGRIQE